MGTIALEDIHLYGKHGYYAFEEDLGCQFMLDVYVQCDIEKAGQSDELADTVNYEDVYTICVNLFYQRHRLLEALAYKMAQQLVTELGVSGARIRIKKLHPPLKGIVGASTIDYSTPGYKV